MDNLYLTGKTPWLLGDQLVNFGDVLPESSKSTACWDMDVNSDLAWLSIPLFSESIQNHQNNLSLSIRDC